MEKGAYELAEALSVNKFLLILNLTGNAIGNEGLSYLLPAIAQSDTLISLNLTSNEIREARSGRSRCEIRCAEVSLRAKLEIAISKVLLRSKKASKTLKRKNDTSFRQHT